MFPDLNTSAAIFLTKAITGGNYIFMWFQYILLMYFFLGLCSLAALISNVALYKSVTLYGKEPVKNQKELSFGHFA